MSMTWHGDKIAANLKAQIEDNMRDAVGYLKNEVKALVDKRGPSRPGDTPAKETGKLLESIDSRVETTAEGVKGSVTADAKHGKTRELGFPGTGPQGDVIDVAPRRFFKPALLDNKQEITRRLAKRRTE